MPAPDEWVPNTEWQDTVTGWHQTPLPYCDYPPRRDLEEGAIYQNPTNGRWYWTNNSDLRIPQSTRDAMNESPPRDPCGPIRTPLPDDSAAPPMAPALPTDTPTDFARTYNDVCAELNRIADEADALVADLTGQVGADLGASRAAADLLTDEQIGMADKAMQDSYQPLAKLLTKAAQDAQRVLTGNSGDLMQAGAQVPLSPAQMEAEQQQDFLQMLGNAFPQMAPALGVAPQVPGFPGLPAMQGAPGIPLPGMGMPPAGGGGLEAPPVGGGPNGPLPVLTPEELAELGYGPGMEGPRPEPVLPGGAVTDIPTYSPGQQYVMPASAGQVVQAQKPTSEGECCPDITVNVTVPPIVLPPHLQMVAAPADAPPISATPTVPPTGTPYDGRPPTSYLIDGRVAWNLDNRRYEWTGPTTTTDAPMYLSGSAPAGPAPAPAPEPPAFTRGSSLLSPIWATTIGETTKHSINWNKPDVCKLVEVDIGALKVPNLKVDLSSVKVGADSWYMGYLKTMFWSYSAEKPPEWGAPVREFFDSVAETAESKVEGAAKWIDQTGSQFILSQIVGESTPNPGAAAFYATKLGIARKLERNTGIPLDYLSMSTEYAFRYSNPQFLPNQIRTDGAFLSGQIDESLWECWTRANGNLPEPARKAMLADQTKPNLRDLIELYRRGHNTKHNLLERAREQGVLNPAYIDEWLAVTKAIPTQSDLIRFMVRDASDKDVAEKYGYDLGFPEKYTGQMKEWATALGLDETYFKYSWRAHWDIPSYTQLTEMIARLRPDRLEVKEWEKQYQPNPNEPYELGAPPRPRSVTREDVRQALTINDMAPGWVENLIDISYTPINRTDAIRAYMTGAFNDAQLRDAFLNVRYSERDADTMLAFYRRDKERRLRNITGSWSPRKVVTYFKQHLLTYLEAEKLLADVLPSKQLVEKTLEEAELDIIAAERKVAMSSLKRQYMLGEHTDGQTRLILAEIGTDPEANKRIVDVWRIERDGRRKLPTVAMLSKWLKSAIISAGEARQRLLNLGYAAVDADRIVAAGLQMDFEGNPPSNEELSDAIHEAIRNQTAARRAADTTLAGRLNQLLREANRLFAEQQRRRAHRGQEPLPAPQIGG